jgi:hypothetical protein
MVGALALEGYADPHITSAVIQPEICTKGSVAREYQSDEARTDLLDAVRKPNRIPGRLLRALDRGHEAKSGSNFTSR